MDADSLAVLVDVSTSTMLVLNSSAAPGNRIRSDVKSLVENVYPLSVRNLVCFPRCNCHADVDDGTTVIFSAEES